MEQPNPSPPASPDSDLAALKAAVADLAARVAALERSAIPVQPPNPAKDRALTESRFGLTVVNRIGAVTLAIGIIFFFKFAADNQWIGAGGLVIVGLLAGIALIGAGEWLRPRSDPAFAQGLAGCGFAILYISVYASFGYYKLVPQQLGFAGLVIVSAGALLICFRFLSPAIAAVGFTGAFVAPLLARKHPEAVSFWLYFVYILLLSLISVEIVRRLYRASQRIPALLLVPFNAIWLVLMAQVLVDAHSPSAFLLLILAVAAVHFGAALGAREMARLFPFFYLCGHACVLIAGFRAIALWTATSNLQSALDSVLMGVYGVVAIVAGLLGSSVVNRWLGLALLAAVIVKLYVNDVWLLTRGYRIGAFVVLGALLLAASYLYSRFKSRAGTISR